MKTCIPPDKYKISIIVPIYNIASYLPKCIESIISQTYTNLEIILVDDGSTDNCPNICDLYQRKDPRIIVIHKKNGGLSDARNAGIRYSSGDYLMFVDGDDYINNEMCQILLDTSLQTNSDIVSCNFFRCNQHASTPSVMSLRDTPKSYKGKELFLYYFTKGPSTDLTVVWNKLYKRKLFFDKHMIRFPIGRNQEDESTTYKLYYLSKKITIIPTPLYY